MGILQKALLLGFDHSPNGRLMSLIGENSNTQAAQKESLPNCNYTILKSGMSQLNLSQAEQDALAELCCMMSSAKYQWLGNGESPNPAVLENSVIDIVEKFPNIHWGTLYDKLHRTGKNA